jgi:aminopeptidase N
MEENLARLESVTKAGLLYYEEYLKTPYPFTKYGNLFAPYFSFNAMENPGLVLISQKNLL